MYLIIENIQEQFELYFNHEKNIELINNISLSFYFPNNFVHHPSFSDGVPQECLSFLLV